MLKIHPTRSNFGDKLVGKVTDQEMAVQFSDATFLVTKFPQTLRTLKPNCSLPFRVVKV